MALAPVVVTEPKKVKGKEEDLYKKEIQGMRSQVHQPNDCCFAGWTTEQHLHHSQYHQKTLWVL